MELIGIEVKEDLFLGELQIQSQDIGIVESVSNGRVNTIEGNIEDAVKRCSYYLNYSDILGYGVNGGIGTESSNKDEILNLVDLI